MKLVPAGPFCMGAATSDSPATERPSHTVYLSAYNIDPFPVTNADYREFVNCTGYKTPINWQRGTFPTGMGRHPITNVSWQDAKAYCDWAGVRLSSEAEWEKAARGEEERCNSTNFYGTTTPVDEFPEGRSPFGLWDMAGNAYEWINDHYDEEYYKTSPAYQSQRTGGRPGARGAWRRLPGDTCRRALHPSHRTGRDLQSGQYRFPRRHGRGVSFPRGAPHV
jgi:formylglycine-generating enzyme required for sulfatase activity